jgi:hypothetical protein
MIIFVHKQTKPNSIIYSIQFIIHLRTPSRTRTCDLRFRRPLLYPVELSGQLSGRGDLNSRPPAPKAGALTGLRYAPMRFSPKSKVENSRSQEVRSWTLASLCSWRINQINLPGHRVIPPVAGLYRDAAPPCAQRENTTQPNSALSTQHSALSTQNSALRIQNSEFSSGE